MCMSCGNVYKSKKTYYKWHAFVSEYSKQCYFSNLGSLQLSDYLRGLTVTLTKASPYFPSAVTTTLNVYNPATSWNIKHW